MSMNLKSQCQISIFEVLFLDRLLECSILTYFNLRWNETVVFSVCIVDDWRQGDDLCSLPHKYTPFLFFFNRNSVFQVQTGAFVFFCRFGAEIFT